MGIGSKHFTSASLEVIVSDATTVSTLWFLDQWIMAISETVLCIEIQGVYSLPENPSPVLQSIAIYLGSSLVFN